MSWAFRSKKEGVIAHAELRDAQRGAATARIVILTIAGFLLGAIWLSVSTTVPELVRAHGELVPTGHYQQVQAPEQGVVRSVLVSEGDSVDAGQVLTVLTSVELKQALDDVSQSLTAQEVRLENLQVIASIAEMPSGTPGDLTAKVPPSDRDLSYARTQLQLFSEQQDVHKQIKSYLEDTQKTLENARKLTLKRIAERKARVERAEQLFAQNLTPRRDVERQKDSLDQLEASLIEIDIRLSQAAKELGSTLAPLEQNRIALLERVNQETHDLTQAIAQLMLQRAALQARQQSLTIRAPEAGVIHAVSFPNPGEVIPTGTTLFELLPSGPQLMAQLKIDPVDIGHIRRGDTVALKFDTFDPRRFGQITGEIAGISPNSVVDEQTGQGHFRATVMLERETIGDGQWRRDLQAGMGASAEIVTDERTVLAYLMKPIKRSLDSAFGER